jgi:pyruvyltransferase
MKLFCYRPRNGQNFGDELGPLIVNYLLDLFDFKQCSNSQSVNFFSIGSVIHFSTKGDVVLGSGINAKVITPVSQISTNYFAVRGPRTQYMLRSNGINCPSTFGDPANLLPKFYKSNLNKASAGKILIIPNYNDFTKVAIDYENTGYSDMLLLHPFTHAQTTVDLIANCKGVITSSLHAKIIADCYGTPSSILGGDGYAEFPFKYVDYLEGIGHSKIEFFPDVLSSLQKLSDPLEISKNITHDLIEAFPKELFCAP